MEVFSAWRALCCVSMQTAVFFTGRIIKYSSRFTRRHSACSQRVKVVCTGCGGKRVISSAPLFASPPCSVNDTLPCSICWGVAGLFTSLSAALSLHRDAPNIKPVSRTRARREQLTFIDQLFPSFCFLPQGNRRTRGRHGNRPLATASDRGRAAPGPDGGSERWVLYLLVLPPPLPHRPSIYLLAKSAHSFYLGGGGVCGHVLCLGLLMEGNKPDWLIDSPCIHIDFFFQCVGCPEDAFLGANSVCTTRCNCGNKHSSWMLVFGPWLVLLLYCVLYSVCS